MLVTRRLCDACGCAKPKAEPTTERERDTRACHVDGVPLDAGWCAIGQGYPITIACPFVCPTCRRRLDWNGACFQCRTWPGDRYEYGHAGLDPSHYTMTAKGPGRRATAEEVHDAVTAIDAVLIKAQIAGRLGGRPERPLRVGPDLETRVKTVDTEPAWITDEDSATVADSAGA